MRFQDKAGLLRRDSARIRVLIDSTVRLVSSVLPVSTVTILVNPDARRSIPGYGVGGFTPNATLVLISIDPIYVDSEMVLAPHLVQTVAHELHHTVRDKGPGYGESLLEALVSEGLADRFAIELLRIPPPPWTHALTAAQLENFLAEAKGQFDRPHDHARWFFGAGNLPEWTGYTLGYHLVSKYLQAHPGQTAGSLVDLPAQAFRP